MQTWRNIGLLVLCGLVIIFLNGLPQVFDDIDRSYLLQAKLSSSSIKTVRTVIW